MLVLDLRLLEKRITWNIGSIGFVFAAVLPWLAFHWVCSGIGSAQLDVHSNVYSCDFPRFDGMQGLKV